MARLILFNKPWGVLSQFRGQSPTLKDFIDLPDCYPAGRLDKDSEGLLLLTDDGKLQAQIADPAHKLAKSYWVQVEGQPDAAQIKALCQGVELKDGLTRPAVVTLANPGLPARNPPVRTRAAIPTAWLSITIREGRNRQVRRMTAAVGLPTLRLYRYQVGSWTLGELAPGEFTVTKVHPRAPDARRPPSRRRWPGS